jgi:hypothetical protein
LVEFDSLVAIIVALISAGVSISSILITNRYAKKLAASNREHEQKLKYLENELAARRAEQDARRNYEFDAKKRLYQQFEPLLFQLVEYSESSLTRIRNFVKVAKKGNLNPKDGMLSDYGKGSYTISTIYRLLLPIVVFKLMQRTLTMFDLDLVPSYKVQYTFAKFLHFSFRADFYLSEAKPSLPYNPKKHSDYKGNEKIAERDRLQGIDAGIIDNMAEDLITNDSNGNPKIMSYGEFKKMYFEPEVKEPFKEIAYLFHNFHPKTSPVLWRILIAQAHIYNALIKIRKTKNYKIPEEDRKYYDWRQTDNEASYEEALVQPFDAVGEYLSNHDDLKDYYMDSKTTRPE